MSSCGRPEAGYSLNARELQNETRQQHVGYFGWLRLTNNTLIVMKKIITRHEPISIDSCEPHRHTAKMSKAPTPPTPRRKPSLCSHLLAGTGAAPGAAPGGWVARVDGDRSSDVDSVGWSTPSGSSPEWYGFGRTDAGNERYTVSWSVLQRPIVRLSPIAPAHWLSLSPIPRGRNPGLVR